VTLFLFSNKSRYFISILLIFVVTIVGAKEKNTSELFTPKGEKMLNNKSFDDSEQARIKILELYKDLRVADVSDAMDLIGLQDIGLMDENIRPIWQDVEDFSHKILGFAITVRHVPTDVRIGEKSFPDVEGFKEFRDQQLGRSHAGAWLNTAKPGDVLVIDCNGIPEDGYVGSNNSLGWLSKGIVGVVTDGRGVRDIDEIVKLKRLPVYCKNGYSSRGRRAGRWLIESYNFPINCGDVLVYPGDLIVGDGDGVIVVPREHAIEVGKIAREIYIQDETSRGKKYERFGIPTDETIIIEDESEENE
jgi:regulator of RNase E activity RraA